MINKYYRVLVNLMQDESGQDLIEYALIAALVALAAVAAIQGVTTEITAVFGNITNALTAAA
ncbi:MAG: Flp family type IVb pilin [Acidobacteriaceae bacterium]